MKTFARVRSSAPTSAIELDRLYDHGYFHGATSGYSSDGYRNCHPDWEAWLELVQAIKPSGRLIDLGCAYGLSVQAARSRGFDAFGFDVSSFALTQEEGLAGRLGRCDIQRLPLPDGVADVVLLLDVLEHLGDPVAGLEEAVRVLAPDGLLVAATPDPLFFDRTESTHFSERPPSYWIRRLEELGCFVTFRFSVVPYNFQFLACRSTSRLTERIACFQHDTFSEEPEFCQATGIRVVPRWGWGERRGNSRPIKESGASLYLLNESDAPLACRVEFRVTSAGSFGTLGIRLDSWLLWREFLHSEQSEYTILLDDVPVPSGGHHLAFDLTPEQEGIRIEQVRITTAPMARAELTGSLPFDLYQRYQGVAELISIIRPESILDVGGHIGDEGGHIAVSADFFQAEDGSRQIVSTDFRHCDHPDHVASDGLALPFEEDAFEAVVSLDVLEHIQPERRKGFLEELARVARDWVVIAAPFRSAEVERAESSLVSGIMRGHRFLDEHHQLGLPLPEEMREFCRSRKVPFWEVPNGNLDNWVFLQTLNALFFGSGRAETVRSFNRIYAEQFFPADHWPPVYRRLFLIYIGTGATPGESRIRDPRIDTVDSRIREIVRIREERRRDIREAALLPQFQELFLRVGEEGSARLKALNDVQFLANARTEHIALLLEERASLIHQLEQTPLLELAKRRWKQRRGTASHD